MLNKSTRYYSRNQEKKVAKSIGGKVVPNSGATAFHKGDVCTYDWLIECKTRTKRCCSMTIKEDWLEKNAEEAFAMGKHNSALCFDFGPNTDRYYVIPEKLFNQLCHYLETEI